jgi:hypothetical protein
LRANYKRRVEVVEMRERDRLYDVNGEEINR